MPFECSFFIEFTVSFTYYFILSTCYYFVKSHANPLLQAVAIPYPHSSVFPDMAPVAPLADGSHLKKTKTAATFAPVLFF